MVILMSNIDGNWCFKSRDKLISIILSSKLALDDDGDDVMGKLSLVSSEIKIGCKLVLDCLAKEAVSQVMDKLRYVKLGSSDESKALPKA
ncbi:hypothetical protein Tco_0025528 [Tanacetum coccineum]